VIKLSSLNKEYLYLCCFFVAAAVIVLKGWGDTKNTARLVSKFQLFLIFIYPVIFGFRGYFKTLNRFPKYIWISFGAWFICSLISFISITYLDSIYNEKDQKVSLYFYVFVLIHIVFVSVMYSFFQRVAVDKALLLLNIFSLLGCFIALYFLVVLWTEVQSGVNIKVLSSKWFHDPPFASHIRHIGYLLAVSTLSSFLLYNYSVSKEKAYIYAFLFLINSTFLFWLGGRGAAVSFLIVAAWYISCVKSFVIIDFRRISAFVVLLIISGLISEYLSIFSWNGASRIVPEFIQSAHANTNPVFDMINVYSSDRLTIWKAAWQGIMERPFFGWGVAGYQLLPYKAHAVHVHNSVLQFILQFGFVGAFFLCVLSVAVFLFLFMAYRKSTERGKVFLLSSTSICVVLILQSLIDGTLYHAQPVFIFICFLAMSLSQAVTRNKVEQKLVEI